MEISTAVDSLVALVEQRKRISMQEAATQLDIPLSTIDEWANFLDEEGLIKIEYEFTTPYLVSRESKEPEINYKDKAKFFLKFIQSQDIEKLPESQEKQKLLMQKQLLKEKLDLFINTVKSPENTEVYFKKLEDWFNIFKNNLTKLKPQ